MFDSTYGIDSLNDEQMIEDTISDFWAAKFTTAKAFDSIRVDYGGNIYGTPCRGILDLCESKPASLLSLLGLKSNAKNLTDAQEIIETCQKSVSASAYLV